MEQQLEHFKGVGMAEQLSEGWLLRSGHAGSDYQFRGATRAGQDSRRGLDGMDRPHADTVVSKGFSGGSARADLDSVRGINRNDRAPADAAVSRGCLPGLESGQAGPSLARALASAEATKDRRLARGEHQCPTSSTESPDEDSDSRGVLPGSQSGQAERKPPSLACALASAEAAKARRLVRTEHQRPTSSTERQHLTSRDEDSKPLR